MRLFSWLLKQPVPKQIERYSRFSPSPLSIKQFLDFGECGAAGPHSRHVPRSPPTPRTRGRCLPGPPPPRVSSASGQSPWEPRAGLRDARGLSQGLGFRGSEGQGLALTHRPGLYLESQKTASEDPYRAGRPRPASVASNLLDTDLTALKTC